LALPSRKTIIAVPIESGLRQENTMIDRFRTAAVAGLWGLLLVTWGCGDEAPRQQDNVPREDAPVIAVLSAVKASDLNGFTNAYSKRIREDVEQGDWESNLKEAQGNLKRMYGDYTLDEFAFTFTGDKERGKVSISHKGKESIALPVVNEDGQWKIDAR